MTVRLTPGEVISTARGMVTGELLIADMERHEWQTSMALILSGADPSTFEDVGLVVVPLGPHLAIHWINGTAPGCTFQCRMIHRDDVALLQDECERMLRALYPDGWEGT